MNNPIISADKTPWYQWDTGLTVTVAAEKVNEFHFANRKQGTAYVQAVVNGTAKVPDELLQVAAPIKAYGYVSDGADGQTYVEQSFEVIARNIPADYTYTKTAQKTIRDAEAARDEAVQAAKDAKASELAADDSAVEASKSAQSVGDSASAAATSASNAAKSAGEAATSASDAKAAASKTVEDASELLKTYTDNAKTSADNAATSASAAADSASAAAKSADDAAASVDAINVIAPKTVEGAANATVSNLAVGNKTTANVGFGNVAIGNNATAYNESVSIGDGGTAASSKTSNAVAIGHNSNAEFTNSVALGAFSVCSKVNEVSIGSSATDNVTEYNREITHVSTPTADSSASTKKYTDDNDSKTLSEAKKYTDDNTTNVLIGNVSGKLLHVEDAWPSTFFGVEIEGATEQVTTTGKNLINPEPLKDISNFDTSQYKQGFYVYKFDVPSTGDYTVSVKQSVKDTNYLMISNDPTYGSGQQVWISHPSMALKTSASFNGVSAIYLYFSNDIAKVQDVLTKVGGVQIESGTTATAYEPYTGGKPSRINFSVNVAGTAGEVQVVAMS